MVGNLKRKACPEVYGRTSGLHYQNSSKIQRVAKYQMSDVCFRIVELIYMIHFSIFQVDNIPSVELL